MPRVRGCGMIDPDTVKLIVETIHTTWPSIVFETDPATGETVVVAFDGEHRYRLAGDDPLEILGSLVSELQVRKRC